MSLLITYFVLTVCISGICSVFEAVLFSATPSFVESAAKKGKSGIILRFLKANIDNSVGAVLVVNMFANTLGAAAVGAQSVEVFGEEWAGVVAIIMTLSILYVAEIIPKTLSATYWKKLILPCCYPLIVMYYVAFPFVYISRGITFLFRKDNVAKMSRDEILALMEMGEKSGSLSALEMDVLEHLILQKSLYTKDIMTDKSLVFSLNPDMSLKEALVESNKRAFSRIPLVSCDENGVQSVSALAHRKRILRANLNGEGKKQLDVIAKPMRKVRTDMPVLALLRLFVMKREHLFAVVESNTHDNKNLSDSDIFVGIVSLEDAIHAVLGVGDLQKH